MRRVVLLALPAVLAIAAPAYAKSSFTISGGGFGHGVGMSQYGALGYAQHGWDYRAILGHYFAGTTVQTVDTDTNVRVLIASGRRSVAVTGAGAVTAPTRRPRRLRAAQEYSVSRSGIDRLVLTRGRKKLGTYPSPLRLAPASDATPIAVRGVGAYRGAIELRVTPFGTVNVINDVGLEDYLRGVVANEAMASWPPAALEAQAVAARGYAMTTNRALGTDGFQQYADTRSQVYTGVAGERPSTDAAVAATRGQVVTYEGKPVTTFFFSTSGGHTENVENSFIGAAPKPWLRGVDDPYDTVSPHHRWKPIRMTLGQAARKLKGLVKGGFRGIDVLTRGVSPRVVRAQVIGTRGRTDVTGPQLKARLGLMDSLMYFTTITSEARPDGSPGPQPQPPASTGNGSTGGAVAGRRAEPASVPRGQAIAGRVSSARPGAWIELQRRDGTRWTRAAVAIAARHGRYRVIAPGPGVYRVVYGDAIGPSLRIG